MTFSEKHNGVWLIVWGNIQLPLFLAYIYMKLFFIKVSWGSIISISSTIVWDMSPYASKLLDSFYIYRHGSPKLDSTRMIQRKRKKTIFRGNVGRLWSIFYSFDRLPLQDNDEKMVEGGKEKLHREKTTQIWCISFGRFCILCIPSAPNVINPTKEINYLLLLAIIIWWETSYWLKSQNNHWSSMVSETIASC